MPKLLEEFPPVATADWEAVIRTDLKGADYDKRLIWKTDDGIAVKPYYRSEDLPALATVHRLSTAGWQITDTPPDAISVDAGRFEESGATTVQEIGYALAQGIEFLAANNPAEMTFSFAIGSSYFFQIAKLRAFRLVWRKAIEAFGKPELKTTLHCRTSRWNKSVYDAHNNVLRGTTEAMSAAIGGADSITVEPFDATYKTADAASKRLAVNTQLILKHEAYLDSTADPSAGSYYIESLTDSIARAAWKVMQKIEDAGGFQKASDTGMIPSEIAASRAKKEAAVAQRRRIFVGVNQYPNLSERAAEKIEEHPEPGIHRGPSIFESLRLATERGKTTPVFLLAEFGDLKMRKARSQFITNFLGCAGFEIVTRYFAEPGDILAEPADVIVLCSSDAEYPAVAAALDRKRPVIIAGAPNDAIQNVEYINIKSNAAETLARWQERLAQ